MDNNQLNDDRKGKTITFYSYKGGVGRSMALVNIACLLAKKQKKVLIVDWDLEAPGLHLFFNSDKERNGLVDLFTEVRDFVSIDENDNEEGYAKFFTENLDRFIESDLSPIKGNTVKIDLIKAGKFNDGYTDKLNQLDWLDIYRHSPAIYRTFAYCMERIYDYILIDSRTGLAETGGITTMLMPQKLVLVFAINKQNIDGVKDVAKQAIEYRAKSNDYRGLDIYPLPSRLEGSVVSDYQYWIDLYKKEFENLFKDKYELEECNLNSYFDRSGIRYFPIHAYGENIPVLAESISNPHFISYDYNSFLTVLLKNKPSWEIISLDEELENEKKVGELFQMAINLTKEDKILEAIHVYDQLIEISPERHFYYANRGAMKHILKDFSGAIEDYDLAIGLEENVPFVYSNLGKAFLELKQNSQSMMNFEKSIELDVNNSSGYYGRGLCYKKLNKIADALTDFKKAMDLGSKEAELEYLELKNKLEMES